MNSPPKSALKVDGVEAAEPPVKRYRGSPSIPSSSQNIGVPIVHPINSYVNSLNNNNNFVPSNNSLNAAAMMQQHLQFLPPGENVLLKNIPCGEGGLGSGDRGPSQSPGATSTGSGGGLDGIGGGVLCIEAGDVKTLFVSGLPYDTKHRELYLLFRSYPGYESCLLKGPTAAKPGVPLNRKQSSPIAFVTFSNRAQAEKAKQDLQGVKFDPELPTTLRLEFARSNTKASTTFNKLKRQHSPQPPLAAALQHVQQHIQLSQPAVSQASSNPLAAPPTSFLPHPFAFPNQHQIHPAVLRLAQMQQVLHMIPGGLQMHPPPNFQFPPQLQQSLPPIGVPLPPAQARRTDPWAAAGQPHPAALAAAAAAAAAGFPIL